MDFNSVEQKNNMTTYFWYFISTNYYCLIITCLIRTKSYCSLILINKNKEIIQIFSRWLTKYELLTALVKAFENEPALSWNLWLE